MEPAPERPARESELFVARRELRGAYDRSAASYEARFGALQAPKHEAVLARVRLASGDRVADLGGGTGLLAARLAGCVASVVVADLSFGMVRRAPAGARRLQADLAALPFADAAFDAAFAITALLLSPRERAAALLEMARVLRPGGALALTVLRSDADTGLERDLRACGLLHGERFDCGQDVGWVCVRTGRATPAPRGA